MRIAPIKAMKAFAEVLLGLDETHVPESQIKAIKDLLSKYKFDVTGKDINKALRILKKKHLVDSILITQKNGSIIATTENGSSTAEAITGTALWNYIASELPRSETALIKTNAWHMIMPYKQKIYIIKASSNLTTIELKALVKELEEFIS